MKRLFALMFVWVAAACFAPRADAFSMACIPVIAGEPIGQVGVYRNILGWHGFYFCRTPPGAAATGSNMTAFVWNCLHSNPKCGFSQAQTIIQDVLLATDRSAAARAAIEENFTEGVCPAAPEGSDQKILCGIALYTMCQSVPSGYNAPTVCAGATLPTIPTPPPPGPEVWKVKANGTNATRVVYMLVAGPPARRGALTNPLITVAVGAVCDQSIRVPETLGKVVTTYMGVPGGIAVCELSKTSTNVEQ